MSGFTMIKDTRQLQLEEVISELPSTSGERRVEYYLRLNKLLQDSEETTEELEYLQQHVTGLVTEFHSDLRHGKTDLVLHITLRTLSIYLYHPHLVPFFSSQEFQTTIEMLTKMMYEAKDEVTFNYCVWCLSVQNYAHISDSLLHRIVDGLVYGLSNPFQSFRGKKVDRTLLMR